MEKPSLQSKFSLLKSNFFPAKIPFSKIWREKNYFAEEGGPFVIERFSDVTNHLTHPQTIPN
jgi:hypothetical protein